MASLGATVRDGAVAGRPGRGAAAPHGRGWSLPGAGQVSRLLIIGVALLGVALLGLLQVLQASQVATVGFQLRTLQAERSTLEAEIRLLEANVAERSQLELLHDEATGRLGMVEPEQTVRVTIDAPAPRAMPLPRRYIEPAPVMEVESDPWWEPLLERIPGFD